MSATEPDYATSELQATSMVHRMVLYTWIV